MGLKELIAMQRALLDAAKAEGRNLTEEEQKEFDNLQRQIDSLKDVDPASGITINPGQGVSDDTERALAEESKRAVEIMTLCREFDMDFSQYIADRSVTPDAVRKIILDNLIKKNGPVDVRAHVNEDGEDSFRAAVIDALCMRTGLDVDNPASGANDFRAMSLRDIAIECLSRDGQSASQLLRMNPDDMYNELSRQFYNPTAAFPAILDNTIKKSIVKLYNQVPTTFQEWTSKGSLKDFKYTPDHEYVIGGTGDFLKVPENGELKADIPSTEMLPNRKLDTYGRQFSMSRQAFINDDIGFLTEIPGLYAARAKKTIDKQVYTLLYDNGAIFDGKALFSNSHSNLMATGEAPSQKSIQSMILKMQQQTDQFGEAIYMTPQYLVVPVGYEFDLAVILHSAQVVGSANNDINPLYNYPITIIQSPILNALAGDGACPWFMVANQMSAKGIQVDYLNGQETPTIRRMESPGILGFTWDIYLDWGINIRDFRGLVKNPGVKVAAV